MTNFRKSAILLLTLIFLSSLAAALWTQLDYTRADQTYAEAAEIAAQPNNTPHVSTTPEESEVLLQPPASVDSQESEEPTEQQIPDSFAQSLFSVDLDALRAKNPDVIGWIIIPETNISYPLLHGTDNSYYLNHTWDGLSSFAGSIFLETQNRTDLQDFNTILYGHNLKNGTMFTQLHEYKHRSFWENHRHVYIVTAEGVRRYEIFAAYEAPVDGPTYWLDVNSDELKQQFLDEAAELSVLDTGIMPATDEKILTLSTCTGYTYERRWVVKARFEGMVVPEQEAPEIEPPYPSADNSSPEHQRGDFPGKSPLHFLHRQFLHRGL